MNKLTCYLTFLINTGTFGPPAEDCQLDYRMTFRTLKTQKLTERGWKPVSGPFEYWFNGNRTSAMRWSLFPPCPNYGRQAFATSEANESSLQSVTLRSPSLPSHK